MAHWAVSPSRLSLFCWICSTSLNGVAQATTQLISPLTVVVNSSSLLASSRTNSTGGGGQVPENVQRILERHAKRQKEQRNATPGSDEMVALRAEAVGLIDLEYDALFQHVAQSLASFVREKNFAPEKKLTNKDIVSLEERTMLAVADELEPRFDRSAGLVGGLYDKAKPHKRREYVADLTKYVPDYCKGQRDRVWTLVRFHVSPADAHDDEKFKAKLKEAGEYIENGIEDYVELSYYSNLMLHGRNASQLNSSQVHQLAAPFQVSFLK